MDMNFILITRGNPFVATSGTEIFVRDLALELCRRGYYVNIICGDGSDTMAEFGCKAEKLHVNKIYLVNMSYIRSLIFCSKCLEYLDKITAEVRPITIISFGAGTLAGYIYRLLRKKVKRKARDSLFVYYAIDSMVLEFKRQLIYSENGGIREILNHIKMCSWYVPLIISDYISCKESDIILASSRDTAKSLIRHYHVPFNKIKVLYFGVRDDFAKGINISEPDIPIFLHIGGSRRKGTVFMLKALKILKEVYGLKVRGIVVRCSKSIRELAKKLDLEIKIHPAIPQHYLKYLYASSTAIVVPSLSEGFCLPVIEAAMFGKPAIVFNVGSLPELVQDGVNGFVIRIADVKALAEKMYIIATDKKLRERLSRSAKEVSRKFRITSVCNELIELLRPGNFYEK